MNHPTKPFALLTWKDAHCVAGNTELTEHEIPHSPALFTVCGWVLRDDAAGITLAAEYSEQGTYRSINFIPAGMIAEVQYVKLAKPKKAKPHVKPETVSGVITTVPAVIS